MLEKEIIAEIHEETIVEKVAKFADDVSEIASTIPHEKAQTFAARAKVVSETVKSLNEDVKQLDSIAERISNKIHDKFPNLKLNFERTILPR